ncbi:hypothetical protein [Pseudochryseolinea flava]|nr:hypothetical protein [Pseudochryseolinea flava]
MSFLQASIFALLSFTVISCGQRDERKKLSSIDSIWVNFKTQLENRNVKFLVANSLDTIQCVDCGDSAGEETEFYDAHFIFQNRLDKVKHFKNLSDKDFTTHESDNLVRVSYNIPSSLFQDHGYNLIFTFVKVKNKYLFAGMIVT